MRTNTRDTHWTVQMMIVSLRHMWSSGCSAFARTFPAAHATVAIDVHFHESTGHRLIDLCVNAEVKEKDCSFPRCLYRCYSSKVNEKDRPCLAWFLVAFPMTDVSLEWRVAVDLRPSLMMFDWIPYLAFHKWFPKESTARSTDGSKHCWDDRTPWAVPTE